MGCGSSTTGSSPGGNKIYQGIDSIEGTDIRDPDPNDQTTLQVVSLNLKIKENAKHHHTDEYDITSGENPKLVIRRGQRFDICIEFNRPYNNQDDLRLVYQFGDKSNPSKGTHIEIVVSDKDEPLSWGAKIIGTEDKQITLTIASPPTLCIGKWKFNVDVIKKEDDKNVIFRYKHKDPIYLLFNPWCKDDQVYHSDNELLDEYCLKETGKIYVGSKSSIKARSWNFGQFEGIVLDCAIYLLDNLSKINPTYRGDPVLIARKLSAVANAPDDGGVLVGNWSGNYSGGTPPLKWAGSVAILNEYYKTKKPVKYGQCWVFSGVVTTLCRAIGIPARSVTNFASAHDCDGTISIDKHWNAQGEELESMNDDSIWNFHVWNECWMARPDLPSGFGGWQIIDATPQETSEDVYCCGPFPLLAVKRGEVNLPYDGAFIFAECNADQVNWIVGAGGRLTKSKINKEKVGQFISTKAPDCKGLQTPSWNCWDVEREDITLEYKYAEEIAVFRPPVLSGMHGYNVFLVVIGTAAERAAVTAANQKGSYLTDLYTPEAEDVKFEITCQKNVNYGEDFELALKFTNESESERTLGGILSTYTTKYTGVKFADVKKDRFSEKVLAPGESSEVKLNVTFKEYFDHLTDDCHFHMVCMSQAKETNQTYTDEDEFQLLKPVLELKSPEQGKVGERFSVTATFKNPLPIPLTKCEVIIEGPGLQEPKTIPQNNVPANAEFSTSFELTPAKPGKKREVIVAFHSLQMENVSGSCKINVLDAYKGD